MAKKKKRESSLFPDSWYLGKTSEPLTDTGEQAARIARALFRTGLARKIK
jgi:hypothetical protein